MRWPHLLVGRSLAFDGLRILDFSFFLTRSSCSLASEVSYTSREPLRWISAILGGDRSSVRELTSIIKRYLTCFYVPVRKRKESFDPKLPKTFFSGGHERQSAFQVLPPMPANSQSPSLKSRRWQLSQPYIVCMDATMFPSHGSQRGMSSKGMAQNCL